MRIAIVGTGIAGLTCAHALHPRHELRIFEANDYAGGHTRTVDVEVAGAHYPVDVGFIIFNHRNYPNFSRLLRALQIRSRPTSMGFSVRCDQSGIEYATHSLNAMLAQRRNLLRADFFRLWRDVRRFYREAPALLAHPEEKLPLGEYLAAERYSRAFVEQHLIPMVAAIWSTDRDQVREFPAALLLRFFEQHGLLSFRDRPQWRVVEGGSRRYVDAMIRGFRDRLELSCPVRRVRRRAGGVEIETDGDSARFDHIIFATHSVQALALLADATAAERAILGALRYQENDVALHTDESVLPRCRRARSSWNYHVRSEDPERVALTYDMNRLQGLAAPIPLLVTVNETDQIDPDQLLLVERFGHPILDGAARRAQQERCAIDGVGRTHFCGAYWGFGFHEDGVRSGLEVCRRFGVDRLDA